MAYAVRTDERHPMVLLLALPVFAAVALVHRYLQLYAPSNLLVRRIRASAPSVRTAVLLLILAATLLLAMHVAATTVEAGAPGSPNAIVLVLAWDAIKVTWLALAVSARLLLRATQRLSRGVAWLRRRGLQRVHRGRNGAQLGDVRYE